jgi:hypothetical protein
MVFDFETIVRALGGDPAAFGEIDVKNLPIGDGGGGGGYRY